MNSYAGKGMFYLFPKLLMYEYISGALYKEELSLSMALDDSSGGIHVSLKLTVRFPKFFTRHVNLTVFPTSPVMLLLMVVSKVGPPVPGVGRSCRKSVKNRFEALCDCSAKKPE